MKRHQNEPSTSRVKHVCQQRSPSCSPSPPPQPQEPMFTLALLVLKDRNVSPFKFIPVCGNLNTDCLLYTVAERRRALQRQVVSVKRHSEIITMYQEQIRQIKKRKKDKLLLSNYKFNWDFERHARPYFYLTYRAMMIYGREPDLGDDDRYPTDEIDITAFLHTRRYLAPKRRIRITENIVPLDDYKVPVYSDIPGETVDDVEIPNSLLYDYVLRNVVNKDREPLLANAITLAEQDDNMIKCTCCSTGTIVPCYNNKDCPCYIANKKLQGLQEYRKIRPDLKHAEFTSLEPVKFETARNVFLTHVAFACSESCACRGKCTNNAMLIPDKNFFNFELFRRNKQVGFELRSTVPIPAGTPIMEFCGSVVSSRNMSEDVTDYAWQISSPDNDQELHKMVKSLKNWTPQFQDVLDYLLEEQYHIDCKYQGNIGRTVCHSCLPNLEVIRVYQRSFTPAHMRLMMVTLVNVYPGIPLTIDYGPHYLEEHFGGKCLCGTIACKTNPGYEDVMKKSTLTIMLAFAKLAEADSKQFSEDKAIAFKLYKDRHLTKFRQDEVEVRKKL